jgi:hypothetical protein
VPDAVTPPVQEIERVVLRDGSVVHIRPISAGDAPALAAAI